jgi:sterol desaturase/sphingolipid hydroxylase (fatty acid hydroxylase superfamily)
MQWTPTALLTTAAFVVVPVVGGLVAHPAVRRALRGRGSVRQTLSNAGVGAVFVAAQLVMRGVTLAAYGAVHARAVAGPFEPEPLTIVLVLLALDAIYYAQHRLEHRVPLLWAVHAVHHQSLDYNLSVSLRVGALAGTTTLLFHLPLAIFGVSPALYAVASTLHALGVATLHARTTRTLGPGRLFNAPAFHRVHHGAEIEYVDKNFGGLLLLFDRVFGTFAPYDREPTFGVLGEPSPRDPITANTAPFALLLERTRRAPRLSQKLRALFWR